MYFILKNKLLKLIKLKYLAMNFTKKKPNWDDNSIFLMLNLFGIRFWKL